MRSLQTLNDEELIALLKEGNGAAFTEIYERNWKKLLQIAWNHTKVTGTAEDIVHEVFTSLWERRESLEIINSGAFLATAVKFSIFKYYQREKRRRQLAEQNYIFDELGSDESQLDALFLKEYIDGLVEELPEKCKLVFRYSREAGMKNNEIAEVMGITGKGVEANLTRALKAIRGGLEKSGAVLLVAHHVYHDFFK